jgi:hypothetical protein
MAADHRSGQAHLVGRTQRIGHDSFGLVEVANLDWAHGDLLRRDGAVMAVFVVPTVHEDDALRALRTSADLRGSVASLKDVRAARMAPS